jgi:hypothetical protein
VFGFTYGIGTGNRKSKKDTQRSATADGAVKMTHVITLQYLGRFPFVVTTLSYIAKRNSYFIGMRELMWRFIDENTVKVE